MTDCNNLENLEKIIGYTFNDKKFLIRSITHSSYAHEKHVKDNETMEFLGDAILNFVITEDLYKNFGNKYKEGLLSKARSNIVSTDSLVEAAEKLGIQNFLKIKIGKSAIKNSRKLYADMIESLIAGVYLDGGMDNAKKVIITMLNEHLTEKALDKFAVKDYKTYLQEYVQGRKMGTIEYKLISKSGLDHEPFFEFAVEIDGKEYGKGTGNSKKQAQTQAAQNALEMFNRGSK